MGRACSASSYAGHRRDDLMIVEGLRGPLQRGTKCTGSEERFSSKSETI